MTPALAGAACWTNVIRFLSNCIYATPPSASTWKHVKCELPSGIPFAILIANVAVMPVGEARTHGSSDGINIRILVNTANLKTELLMQ